MGGVGQKPSGFGAKVADILGEVYSGIYHIDNEDLRAADFTHERFVAIALPGCLATYDADYLTRLVILCHDAAIRLELDAQTVRRRDYDSGMDPPVNGRCSECNAILDVDALANDDASWPHEHDDCAPDQECCEIVSGGDDPVSKDHTLDCEQGIVEYPSLFALFSARTREGEGSIRHYTRHPSIEEAIMTTRGVVPA